MDMAPSRTQLQSLFQRTGESFKEYAQRWRELAARVQPPMLEREQTDMFIGTLQGVFMDRMGSCPFVSFSDVVICGERTESLIKAGKIQDSGSSSTSSKKPFAGAPRRREETNVVHSQRNVNKGQYRQVAAVTIPAPQPQSQQQHPRQQQQQQQQQRPFQPRQRMTDRCFDPLPMTYAELLPELLRLGFVKLRTMAPLKKIPAGYDANVRCDFHSGAPGHHIENCRAFHHKVQDLIDAKTINFAPVSNVVNNPMPQHGGPRVNNVEDGEAVDLVVDVDDVQTSLLVVKERLLKGGVFLGCDGSCSDCDKHENGCMQLRRDRGVVSTVTIYFKPSEGPGRAPRTVNAPVTIGTPVTISAPVTVGTPTTIAASGGRPVENSRAVPWKYDNAFRSNRRPESQKRPVNQAPVTINLSNRTPVTVGPVVDNVGGPGGFTRSGRLFVPQTLRDSSAEALAKASCG
ncbi:hypothetical protein KIW84_075385 [Lathyrus oleraceus]|uniref:Retrotransposon gag domain-containing protein n=1 Tax=Pisum sativum TaxID=3888 RepID=A0A9D5A1U5_PEA|nr:hypothetical protein KIW84_075385 [Pisum sativum]